MLKLLGSACILAGSVLAQMSRLSDRRRQWDTLSDMLSALRMTVDDVMDAAGLPLAGIVPEDPNMTLAAAFGRPLLSYKPHCPAAAAFRRMAGRLQGFHRPIPLK